MANPIVTITMDTGDVIKAELYPEIAPNTVNNFISLIKKGYYDGLKTLLEHMCETGLSSPEKLSGIRFCDTLVKTGLILDWSSCSLIA